MILFFFVEICSKLIHIFEQIDKLIQKFNLPIKIKNSFCEKKKNLFCQLKLFSQAFSFAIFQLIRNYQNEGKHALPKLQDFIEKFDNETLIPLTITLVKYEKYFKQNNYLEIDLDNLLDLLFLIRIYSGISRTYLNPWKNRPNNDEGFSLNLIESICEGFKIIFNDDITHNFRKSIKEPGN